MLVFKFYSSLISLKFRCMQQSNCSRKKILSKLTALLACGLLGFSSLAQGNDLNQIQKQIKQQESKIAEQKRAQAKLQASLKEQESKINSVVGELRETELSLKEIRKQMAETEKQIKQLEKQERVQKEARTANRCYLSLRSKSFNLGKNAFGRCEKSGTHESVLSTLKSSAH